MRAAVVAWPNSKTSTGSGNRPSRLTSLLPSAITIMRLDGDRHDLLAQQRAAAAFDEVEFAVRFVGAVHHQVERREVVEVGQHDAERARELRGALRGRHADELQPAAHARAQQLDKGLGGRARTEAQLHAVGDEVQRAGGRGAFEGGRVGHSRNQADMALCVQPQVPVWEQISAGASYSTVTDFARLRG